MTVHHKHALKCVVGFFFFLVGNCFERLSFAVALTIQCLLQGIEKAGSTQKISQLKGFL